MANRKFTRYPSSSVTATTVTDESVKAYIKQLIDAGDDLQLVFEVGGRFPTLTVKDFGRIVNDLWHEGIEIPGVIY